MKKVFLIAAALTLAATYGCMESKSYKSEYIYNFVSTCVTSGLSIGYCSCMMDHVRDNMSEKAFLEEDGKYVATGKFSDSYMKMVADGKAKCGQ